MVQLVNFGFHSFWRFIHRYDSIYQDTPAKQYQFSSQYLGRVKACVGDWIIYYESRKVADTHGYFAVAKVMRVIPDPNAAGMHIALIEPGSYLDFSNPVPFSGRDGVIKRGVLNDEGRISGRAQSAVRPISPQDFSRIVEQGLAVDATELPRIDAVAPDNAVGFKESPVEFQYEGERTRYLSSRSVRDPVFRKTVLRAYGARCAITGLKLINGGGRAEVEAAHIKALEAGGPDIVSNGLALSGTVHWMFDRGLISIADNLEILISRQVNDSESIKALINKTRRVREPERDVERPHPHFLSWHREHCFKH